MLNFLLLQEQTIFPEASLIGENNYVLVVIFINIKAIKSG